MSATALVAQQGDVLFMDGFESLEDPPGTGAGLPTILEVTDDGTGAARPFAIGMPLAEGALTRGQELVVRNAQGSQVPSQWSPLASWRTDGSQLHGVLVAEIDAGGTYTVEIGTPFSGNAISKADIVASGFDAAISVDLGGTIYSLSAADLLSGVVIPRKDYTHFAGPLSSEYAVGGPLRVNGTGAEHPHLQGHFAVRAFKGGSQVFVGAVLENTGAFEVIADVEANSSMVTVGGATIHVSGAITIFADCMYQRRGWFGGDPGLNAQHDMNYVQSTKLVPGYQDILIDEAFLADLLQSTDWNSTNAVSSSALSSGGAKPELAPYDRYSAAWLIAGDIRAENRVRAINDAFGWTVNPLGSSLLRPRDENTGFPVDLSVHDEVSTVWGIPGTTAFSANRDGSVITADLAHMPSFGYVPYLLTGEFSYLELLQFAGIQPWLNERPGGFNGLIPDRRFGAGGQVRAIGWGFRNMTDAAAITPDTHPLKNVLDSGVVNAIDELDTRARPLDVTDSLGLILTEGIGTAVAFGGGQTQNPNDDGQPGFLGLAPWMQDFLNFAAGNAYTKGYRPELDGSGFYAWITQSSVKRFGTDAESEYCWNYAAIFAMGVRDTETSPFYTSWNEIQDKNFPGTTSCAAPGDVFSLNADRGPTDFGAQIGGGLSLAVTNAVPGAQSAWELYSARTVSWGSLSFAAAPEWAMAPQTGSAPVPPGTELEVAAAILLPGQSIKLDTILPAAILDLGEGSDFLQWGNTAFWNPNTRRLDWLGKRDSVFPLHRLTYVEETNTWSSNNSVPVTGTTFGHGYDHIAGDPVTGDLYYRHFNSRTVYRKPQQSETWSALPDMPTTTVVAAGVTYWPGRGVVYVDQFASRFWNGMTWVQISGAPGNAGLHSVAEYNSTAGVVLYGGGNGGNEMQRINADLTTTVVTPMPENFGAASTQGLFVPMPGQAKMLGWSKNTSAWYEYDIADDSWIALPTAAGTGQTPVNGLPPLSSPRSIACEIAGNNVVMFIQYNAGANADVWLYKP